MDQLRADITASFHLTLASLSRESKANEQLLWGALENSTSGLQDALNFGASKEARELAAQLYLYDDCKNPEAARRCRRPS